MFKRANKITALLVAAASIMSVVPAMAATNLETKDGKFILVDTAGIRRKSKVKEEIERLINKTLNSINKV